MAFTKNIYSFSLDIKRKTGTRVLSVEGDTANQFIVFLTDDGKPIDLTGLYVRAVFRRSDGRTILQSESDEDGPVTKVAESGKVIIPVKNSAYRDGDNYMEIQILDGDPDSGDVLSTSAYMLIRARNCLLTDEATIGSVEFPVLQTLIDALRDIHVIINMVDASTPASGSMVYEDGVYTLTLNIPYPSGTIALIEYNVDTWEDIVAAWEANKLPMCYRVPTNNVWRFYPLVELNKEMKVAWFSAFDRNLDTVTECTATYLDVNNTHWASTTKLMDEVYVAVYGTTLVDDIIDAYEAGKMVFCWNENHHAMASLTMVQKAGTTYNFTFTAFQQLTVRTYLIGTADPTWLSYSNTLQQQLTAGPGITIEGTTISAPGGSDANYIYLATYNTTTYQNIAAAKAAGKFVVCYVPSLDGYAPLARVIPSTHDSYVFATYYGSKAYFYTCASLLGSDTHWSTLTEDLQYQLTAGTGIVIDPNDDTISAPVMTGATATANGAAGIVPPPLIADREKFLRGDGTWQPVSGGGSSADTFVATYGTTSFADVVTAYNAGKTICVDKNNDRAYLYGKETAGGSITALDFVFLSGEDGELTFIYVESGGWGTGSAQALYVEPAGGIPKTDLAFNPMAMGFGYATCSTAAATAQKEVSITGYVADPGAIVAVKFANSVPANATLKINSLAAVPIYHQGSAITANVISAGDTATFMLEVSGSTYKYHLISIDGISSNDLFIATYNSTSYAAIKAAYDAGKVVVCKYGAQGSHNAWYVLTDITESTAANGAFFTAFTSSGYLLSVKAIEANGTTTWTNQSAAYRTASAQDTIDAGKQAQHQTTTLTIATTDWGNNSCTKTVTGMTASALVLIEFSDTETDFTVTQGTDNLTFAVTSVPSAAVTVNVGWFV